MRALLRSLFTTALVAGTTLLGAVGSPVANAQAGPQGTVAVTVVLTGDPGGDIGNVLLSFFTSPSPSAPAVASALAVPGDNTFELSAGLYYFVPTVTDPNYTIASYSCSSPFGPVHGPPENAFVLGTTPFGILPADCRVDVNYTAPPADSAAPPTSEPGDSNTPPVETTVAPTPPTSEPGDSNTPAVETTVVPTPPTTEVSAALPPTAGRDPDSIPVTGPKDQTLPIAVAGLMMLLVGTGAVLAARRR